MVAAVVGDAERLAVALDERLRRADEPVVGMRTSMPPGDSTITSRWSTVAMTCAARSPASLSHERAVMIRWIAASTPLASSSGKSQSKIQDPGQHCPHHRLYPRLMLHGGRAARGGSDVGEGCYDGRMSINGSLMPFAKQLWR